MQKAAYPLLFFVSMLFISLFSVSVIAVTSQPAAAQQGNTNFWSKTVAYTRALGQSSASSGRSMFDLLYSRDDLVEKKAEARRKLIDLFGGYLPGSTEFWIDTVCSSKIPRVGGGFAFVDAQDTIRLVAHIAAERQEITEYFENETTGEVTTKKKYIYKIELIVSNRDGRNESVKFNVYLNGVPLGSSSLKVKDGETISLTGRDAIIQDSVRLYTEICIRFDRDIEVRDGDKYEEIDRLCNTIASPVSIGATPYNPPVPASLIQRIRGSSASGEGAASSLSGVSEGGQGITINDI